MVWYAFCSVAPLCMECQNMSECHFGKWSKSCFRPQKQNPPPIHHGSKKQIQHPEITTQKNQASAISFDNQQLAWLRTLQGGHLCGWLCSKAGPILCWGTAVTIVTCNFIAKNMSNKWVQKKRSIKKNGWNKSSRKFFGSSTHCMYLACFRLIHGGLWGWFTGRGGGGAPSAGLMTSSDDGTPNSNGIIISSHFVGGSATSKNIPRIGNLPLFSGWTKNTTKF